MSFDLPYDDYELEGGARAPSAWNKFVSAHYHDADILRLPAKARLGALAQKARAQGGVLGQTVQRKKSACNSYGIANCAQPECRLVTPKGTNKKGKARKAYCRTTPQGGLKSLPQGW